MPRADDYRGSWARGMEYRVTWKRTKWSAGTWPRRRLFRTWASAIKQAKLLERDVPKYGPIEIEISQRQVGQWMPTVYGRGIEAFDVGDEDPRADSS